MDRHGAHRFLEQLGAHAAGSLREAGTRFECRRGELVMRAGEVGDSVHLLIEGRVKVTREAVSGGEVILDFGWPGDLYGEMSVLSGEPRIGNVIALERVVTRRVSGTAFLRFLDWYPEMRDVAWRMTARRLAAANARRMAGPSDDVPALVARRLLELVRACGQHSAGGWRIDLPLTNRELAQYVPTSESSLDRALARLRSLGLVRTGYREVVVTDLQRLRAVIVEPAG